MQLPVVVAVQRAMARFLDGKGMEIGVNLVDASAMGVSETLGDVGSAGWAGSPGDGEGVTGVAASAGE